jgi:NADH:ubiquinone oxidoreductase subunit 5 (subunit L)/multisubunit Na+/H+ antiporter MnhA subunit
VGEDSPVDTNDVKQTAAKAGDNPVLENAARLGYATSGVLHLLIGWLGLQVAWAGSSGSSADQSGALQALAGNAVGRVMLWLAVVGFLGLTLWQLVEVIVGRAQASDRAKAAAKFVVYLFLAVAAFSYARSGSGTSSSQQSVDFTANLMSQPAGRILVGAVGLAVIGVAIYHVHKGWKKRFLQDLREHPGRWVVRAGVFGYIAKGIALGLVGALFLLAAVRSQPEQATGLDGALHTLRDAPFGPILLTIVALGFACYAIYSFARARYARV